MLFNSYEFLFFYLPTVLAGFYALRRHRSDLALAWLALASLFFYGWWNPKYVLLLLVSVGFNFLAGRHISLMPQGSKARRWLLAGSIAVDLVVLGYYKYANFFVRAVNDLSGAHWGFEEIVLPLGISFFTFTQIAFLVDAYRGRAREYRFVPYLLFVTYFPHLIAGPVLHHGEMMPQFSRDPGGRRIADDFATGFTLFLFGLFKKTVLADGIAPHAQQLFSAAQSQPPMFLESWTGALAYTFQLYFDFSGYSDMAIGLSLLFGIRLPVNFDSPYKATDIADFWRRWHMTLSRFLRDYLYIPLGGNRCAPWRHGLNLFVTMVLGGFWHGANWTYLAWGALHGTYLVIHHGWRSLRRRARWGADPASRPARWAGRLLTFLAVVFGWVLFRSDSLTTAGGILRGMLGLNGLALPAGLKDGALGDYLAAEGWKFSESPLLHGAGPVLWIAVLLLVSVAMPNTNEIFARFRPGLNGARVGSHEARFWQWRPDRAWALLSIVVGVAAVCAISGLSEFIYFQF
ncbi:MBOAT family O-acyltransferase [Methylococcus capsulatus]|jgi:D-alanyl-lipoteichoic acid acyltransferase DltB (MBOAT superfamily)|uniref:Probable alginate O-acetylase n=1 Tax=Methylococcus capsulatus (strain ATCC 33009 / NCIMB 11132 / Bath) TaxID=243233 RepID=Q602I9_METCA|nr:MBOAT family protein [Methylococcus capsulatus]AAU90842.1 putative alginate O-acetyltransferase [Methylococcus capsulatus str. Bath]QXP89257.1 MBOAT family protein [Methylococcus capsulatus]